MVQVDGAGLRIEAVEDLRITKLRIDFHPVFSTSSGRFEKGSCHDASRGHRPSAGGSRRPRHAVAHRARARPGRLRRRCPRRPRAGRRQRPDVVILDPQLLDGDGLGTCRRLRALDPAPRVVLYSAGGDPTLPVTARVAGADGLVDKAAPAPRSSSRRSGWSRAAPTALPPLDREQLDAAAPSRRRRGSGAAGDAGGSHRARGRRGDAAAGPAQASRGASSELLGRLRVAAGRARSRPEA